MLGIKTHDVINTKQETITRSIKDPFEGKNMQSEYSVLGYLIDLYFHDYKLATEVDEKDFNIFKVINKLNGNIEELNKKSLMDKISKRLLELELTSEVLIKFKVLKNVVKKILSST